MNNLTEKLVNAVLDADGTISRDQRKGVFCILSGQTLDQLPACLRNLVEKSRPVMARTPTVSDGNPKTYLRRHEAAKYIGCSVRQIDLLKHNGDLPFHRLGRRLIVFKVEDLEWLMQKRRVSLEDDHSR